jgi:hypothetical protein
MRIRLRRFPVVFTILVTIAVVTVALPAVAVARIFHCASGDVFCLIASIRSANERPGPDTIIVEAGSYVPPANDNTEDSLAGNAFPSVTGRLTIEGAGASDTNIGRPGGDFGYDGNVFHIAPTGSLTLRGITTGRVFNRGTLRVFNSVITRASTGITGNFAAINLGTLEVVDSHVNSSAADFNGGIASSGSLHILRSTIAFNDGNFSIGISAGGIIAIEDSTIAFNGEGVGLAIGGTATITNTTIAKNSNVQVGGGLTVFGGNVKLTNVTIADNASFGLPFLPPSGGITVFDGRVELQNSIVARNGQDCAGTLISLGNNIIGDTAGCSIDLRPSDYVGDARLGQFVDDGTPGGGHIPLLADSPAIDAANRQECPNRDQLGQRRANATRHGRPFCDIGAVEFIP